MVSEKVPLSSVGGTGGVALVESRGHSRHSAGRGERRLVTGPSVEPTIAVGQLVRLKADPTRSGPVIEVLPPAGGQNRYRVFHSAESLGEYYQDQLEVIESPRGSDQYIDAMVAGEWTADFRAQFAAARLLHPEADGLYALRAARIRFIPFQFKPVLRFLRSDRPRLLIADDVGVGKTIEAGLILKELQTRQQLGNVLIVCPKALTIKWRAEMRRFDEDFHILDSRSLRYCIDETHLDGVWPEKFSRAIVHLELLRVEGYLQGMDGARPKQGLLTLDPAPQFGLVIMDEAHHVRNPSTYSHQAAEFLSEVSEAMVLLSATPVQTSSKDLFHILRLLRPDQFGSFEVFKEMSEPNRHLSAAMRAIRLDVDDQPWAEVARNEMEAAAATAWGSRSLRDDPRFVSVNEGLSQESTPTDADRVRFLRELEELHSFATVMNRTRRRDIGKFTIRDPRTVEVAFTPAQQDLYDELIAFRLRLAERQHGAQVARLIIDTLERQAASSLHALAPTLDAFVARGLNVLSELTDDPEYVDEDDGQGALIDADLTASAELIRQRAAALPAEDPKVDRLLDIVRESMSPARPGKTLVFSFFLHTLAYLEDKLRDAGYRVTRVTGAVDDAEREHRRDRFRLHREHPDAIDVLLSSEVGCEGLDYEFCDQVVNFDLPWNPMRVEQRIGRIDRFGQQSEKVLIFNFVTPGTVEERVFFRAYERLGIFRDTVGDMEEVLGELTSELNRAALDPTLTDAQAERKALQLADNQIRLIEEQRRLEDQSRDLFGLDDIFSSDVDDVVAAERFVPPSDVAHLVKAYVGTLPKSSLDETSREEQRWKLVLSDVAKTALRTRLRSRDTRSRGDAQFIHWLGTDAQALELTFDQDRALEERSLPFVTPVHPLARLAVSELGARNAPTVARLVLEDDVLEVGSYLFVCELWESIAVRRGVRLVTAAVGLSSLREAPEVAAALPQALSRATESTLPLALDRHTLERAGAVAADALHARRERELTALAEENELLFRQRLASVTANHDAHLAAIDERVEGELSQKILTMKHAERVRAGHRFEDQRTSLERGRSIDIVARRIAAGSLEVTRGH